MELTIEQALQQGIAVHKEGKLKEAERLYRAILRSQPFHPDANHNLGVLSVSVSKVVEALPLFKIALDKNPKIDQFWISYIDALIKDHQFELARLLIQEAKKEGVNEKKLNPLKKKLESIPKNKNNKKEIPAKKKINTLLELLKFERYKEAEILALSLTQQFPKHQFSWKALGVIKQKIGRSVESEYAYQKAVELSPQDPEAHYNLSVTLQDMKRSKETELSLKRAIALKEDYFEAHNNLGILLKGLGRLEEAELSFKNAIAFNPSYFEAHNNLGIVFKEQGRSGESELYLKQAIALKPDFSEAHHNLAIVLKEQGKLKEAEESYRQAIALKPNFFEAQNGLLRCLFSLGKKSLLSEELDYLIDQGKVNAVIGSLTYRSSLKYGIKKHNIFCNEPLKYVSHTDLKIQYDFNKIFIQEVGSILNENRLEKRNQSLLFNGYQTSGNLFSIENRVIKEIQKIIQLEIERYRINFKKSQEGFIKKWPANYSLYGWLINMKSGGKLNPHIHDQGWISGSVYINVPFKSNSEDGNLVVSLGEEKDVSDKLVNLKKIINVVTGSLVLFPGSLTHYTIPFEAEEDRIVLAFDVKPKDHI
ncbi:tetratricopeptide repeat protein [Hyphomicrobiales bacterium]|nr:tetratricopeptide repeat protein [Hyphomicrobiales bacterium]